ncbi:MAG: SsrA-binding protein SmpB [Chloroflexi bacterium]|nr:SsrA-binding protein SmpB [Chloroflexota bacterium]
MKEPEEEKLKVVADNRRAFYDYAIDRKIEAGLALTGTEIKSIRAGKVNLREGYARVDKGQAWLRGVNIAPWTHASFENHEPLRPRRLLLHKGEIRLLAGEVSQKGYTIVPLRLYLKGGLAKVELGLAKGKKRYDKRQTIKERESDREIAAVARRREVNRPR